MPSIVADDMSVQGGVDNIRQYIIMTIIIVVIIVIVI